MFEQSILIDHTGARKTGAFALSLTAQILLAGVLLVVPLIYQESLPVVRFDAVLPMPKFVTPAPDPPASSQAPSRRSGLAGPRVFRARIPVPQHGPQGQTSIADDAPGIVMSPGAPGDVLISDFRQPITMERPAPPSASKPTVLPEPDRPVQVSGGVQAAKLVKQVIPTYPQLAVRMRASGVVHLLGIIGKDGGIQNLRVLSGNPLLTQAALEAVQQWVYSPTILSGRAVEVEAPIDVIFTIK